MARYASKVVEQMQKWIGKKESDGSHKEIIDIYNSQKKLPRGYRVKYTDSWCATTGSAVAIKLGYTDIIPLECSCGHQITLWKEKGCWVEDDKHVPGPGDYIYYDWDDTGKGDCTGWPEHVGVVEKVANGVITVIEGNYSNAVKRRKIDVGAKNIRGYGVPKYDAEKPKKETVAVKKDESKYYDKYTGKAATLDTVLKAVGVPAKYRNNWAKRRPLAQAQGIDNYTGKSFQNLKLINLAREGKLKKVL